MSPTKQKTPMSALKKEEARVMGAFNARRETEARSISLELSEAECWLAAYTNLKRKGEHERASTLTDKQTEDNRALIESECREFFTREITAMLRTDLQNIARGLHRDIGRGTLLPEAYEYPPDSDFDGDIPF